MSIVIDELSNSVLTDAEISHRVKSMIESQYSISSQMKISRLYIANPTDPTAKANFDAYNLDVEAIRAEGVAAKAKAAIVREAIAWEESNDLTVVPTPEVQAVLNARSAARPIDLLV